MKKEKEKKRKYPFVKAGIVICIALGFIWSLAGPYPELVSDDGKSWHIIWEGSFADAMELGDPGADVSGIIAIYIMNSTGTTDGARVENNTYTIQDWCNASGLGYTNADDTQIDIAHTTNFEIWVAIRGNITNCKRGATWWSSDVRVRITSSDLGIGADTVCNNFNASNNTAFTFLYLNCVLVGPYTIAKGASAGDAEIDNIKLEFYY